MTNTRKFVGYIRVSTTKQGTQGVSLPEQRDAILRYCRQHNLEIIQWFEERETAAKSGRPVFGSMLKFVRMHQDVGVVVHKVDRSARNLADWAQLGELIDGGIDVRFASENLDLHTRGGRLTADIQAVIAADFIRNLREDTKNGMHGRLKQGLYPLPAPIGYLNQGPGKVKVPDPLAAPLIQKAFELYASGNHSLASLCGELPRLGLRTRGGGKISVNGVSVILRNPFYIGLLRAKTAGEVFPGKHEPLISKSIFDRVQARLDGKVRTRGWVHEFLFRRLLQCAHCEYALIGERQKGHAYYRCHTPGCPTKGVREEDVNQRMLFTAAAIRLSEEELDRARSWLERLRTNWGKASEQMTNALGLQRDQLKARLDRLTDAYLDGALDREAFTSRKESLLMAEKTLQERERQLIANAQSAPKRVHEFLELVQRPLLLYETAVPARKRSFVEIVTSNRVVDRKSIEFTVVPPFSFLVEQSEFSNGSPQRGTPRTAEELIMKLVKFFTEHDCPRMD